MPQKITETATLLCNKGAKTSQLKVTSQNFSKADNKLVATENDKNAEVNIPSFGICTVTRGKCLPNITKWENPTEKDSINNLKILTENSSCQCSIGGKILIQDKGHEEKHNADL